MTDSTFPAFPDQDTAPAEPVTQEFSAVAPEVSTPFAEASATEAGDDVDTDDYEYDQDDSAEDNSSAGNRSQRKGIDRGAARRIATKALALQEATPETLDVLRTLLGSTAADPVTLTLDIMVSSPAEARRIGNSLTALRAQFDDDPMSAVFAVAELDRASLEQVWRLVHALGQDLPPRPPAAIGKAFRPLTEAIGKISDQTAAVLADAIALTVRS